MRWGVHIEQLHFNVMNKKSRGAVQQMNRAQALH